MEFWKVLLDMWPIASAITPLLIGAGILWLNSKFAVRSETARIDADITALAKRLDHKNAQQDAATFAFDTRVQLLEREVSSPPTRHDMMRQLGEFAGRMGAVESSVKGISKQLGTTNDYLQTLVEQEIRK